MNYKAYMRSSQWKEKRHAKLEACNSKCECDGGCTREATQIHHLHYDTLGNESMEDLQALCPKCHMQKSNVRNFYGTTRYKCCLLSGEADPPKKTLPYSVWHEANNHYKWMGNKSTEEYDKIASALNTEPLIVALLDNMGIMFACGDIAVEDKVTAAIGQFVDIIHVFDEDTQQFLDKEPENLDDFLKQQKKMQEIYDKHLSSKDHDERCLCGVTDTFYKIKAEFREHFKRKETL